MQKICLWILMAVLSSVALFLTCGSALSGFAGFDIPHEASAMGNRSQQELLSCAASNAVPSSWPSKSVFVSSAGPVVLPIAQIAQAVVEPKADSDIGWDSHEWSKNVGGAGAVLFVIFGVILFSRRKKRKE